MLTSYKRLDILNKLFQWMQKEQKKCFRSPCFLHSYQDSDVYVQETINGTSQRQDNHKQAPSTEEIKKDTSAIVNESPKSFASRYEGEIGPPSKIVEYSNIAKSHRTELLKETKYLQQKFSHDLQQANDIEKTVNSISNMLGEFVRILQSQSGTVEDAHTTSKAATHNITQTADELLLTIERSQSHQRNIVIITILLALLLLFLDFVTP